eukprot:TRINITY_DN7062_c4_g1_i1.p1 TRINITY_DN7062_c4_g1~~TRINITY_DN7062_c4_g1_i1.p1  ORF type:complete len:283 (+),score=39.08 TRINITY_DN7062_c4_g1_i1:86-934(+)
MDGIRLTEYEEIRNCIYFSSVLFVLVGIQRLLCYCCCARCCCQEPDPAKGEVEVKIDGKLVKTKHLLQVKEAKTAYILLWTGGVFGAHHWYLGRYTHACIAALTFNFFSIGWMFDLVFLPGYMAAYNRSTQYIAPYDGQFPRLCKLFPITAATIISIFLSSMAGIPRIVHGTGMIDLHQSLAGTNQNPFQLLDIDESFDISRSQLKDALQRSKKKLEKDPSTCTKKTCKAEHDDLKKAYEFVSRGRRSGDLNYEWIIIKDAFLDFPVLSPIKGFFVSYANRN